VRSRYLDTRSLLTDIIVIDPWTFTTTVSSHITRRPAFADPYQVSRDKDTGGTHLTIFARERLDVNISTTLIELALSMFSHWSKEGDEVLALARGSYAPYRIRNRTGSPVNIWGDAEGLSIQEVAPTRIQNNETVDWRFDDWKTMREVRFPGPRWE
jgi:vacuolar protein sorting-associated protein 13A/C